MGKAAAAAREELEGQMSIDDILVPLGEPTVEDLSAGPVTTTCPDTTKGRLPVR